MIDHFGFRVRDLERARLFYDAILPPLGLQAVDNTAESFLIGRSAEEPLPFIWVGVAQPAFWTVEHEISRSPIHVGFKHRRARRSTRSTTRHWPLGARTMARPVRVVPPK